MTQSQAGNGTIDYTYNDANRLIEVNGQASYAYDGLGNRLQQTVDEVTTTYTLDLNTAYTQVLTDGTNTYLYGLDRIAQQNQADTEYFLGDALGSVRQLTNSVGDVTLTKAYDPYGNTILSVGDGQTEYGYTGEYTDPTGLVYLRARYYQPEMGRFTQSDTVVPDPNNPVEWNYFIYSRNNPIRYSDPSGKISCERINDAECNARAFQLKDVAKDIKERVKSGALMPVEGLATLSSKAMDLFDHDLRGMAWGMTVVIDGFDPNEGAVWKQARYGGGNSSYFIGQNWLPYKNNPQKDDPNWGNSHNTWIHSLRGDWRKEYWDKTANQAYHFWFYVSAQFFDEGAWSLLGNLYHDNPLEWDKYDYINSPSDEAPPYNGISQPDYALGIAGMNLGIRMETEYRLINYISSLDCGNDSLLTTKFDPASWIRSNLKE